MSKTFKSAWPNHPRRINVREIEDGVNVRISDPQWEDKKGITIAPSDAPALALAILEAAGYDDKADDMSQADAHAFNAMHKLQQSVDEQERATVEAKAQAELEAEALELRNEYFNAVGSKRLWTDLNEDGHRIWLAVARKAREMAKEATK